MKQITPVKKTRNRESIFDRMMQFKIDQELYDLIDARARKEKTNMSHVIRKACEEYVRK